MAVLRSVLAILFVFNAAVVTAQDAAPLLFPTISVIGKGEISVPPDMASVSIGVQADAETSADAMDQASAAIGAVLGNVAAAGVEDADVQSSAIRLTPRYAQTVLGNTDFSRIESYAASNTISVTVRDLDSLGDLLSSVVGEGANTINGISFGLQEPEIIEDEARRMAVAEGRRLAELYADAAGVTLGDLFRLEDQGGAGYRIEPAPPVLAEYASSSAPQFQVPVAPGEITLSSRISLIYRIAE